MDILSLIKKEREWKPFLILVVIFLLTIVAYSKSLQGDFVWDDIPQIVDNPYIKDLSNIPYFFKKGVWAASRLGLESNPYYRPVVLSSIALDYKLWKLNPAGYRITNLLLHLILIYLVYLFSFMLLKDRPAALLSSALFGLFPPDTEVVAWISGRTDMIAGIFLISAFILHNKKIYLSLILFILSLLSKETSSVLPLIIWAYGIVNGEKPYNALKATIPYLIILLLYLFFRIIIFEGSNLGMSLSLSNFILLLKAILHYMRFFILPWPVVFIPNQAFPDTLLMDIAGAIVFSCLILFLLKKQKWITLFLLSWIFLTLLPSLLTLFNPMINTIAYRFLYLPSVGYAMLAGLFIMNALRGSRRYIRFAFLSIASVILVLYSMIVYISGYNYMSTISLWENSLRYFPDSYFAHASIGFFLDHEPERQIYHLRKAIELDPSAPIIGNIYIALGTAFGRTGDYTSARGYLLKGIEKSITNSARSVGYNSLGNIYYLEGNLPQAMAMYKKAIEIDDMNKEAYFNLGLVLKAMGRTDEAMGYIKRH